LALLVGCQGEQLITMGISEEKVSNSLKLLPTNFKIIFWRPRISTPMAVFQYHFYQK
jgi:hypothetical protein